MGRRVPELNPSAISSGPGTPYVTPAMLTAAPTGIVWSTIGPGARPSPIEQFNEQLNLCRRSTSMIDGYCNQPLRATMDVETLFGPGDFRFQMQPNGNGRLTLSRSPVTYVAGGRVAMAATFPPQWTSLAPSAFKPAIPLMGVYGSAVPGGSDNSGQAVYVAPGTVSWLAGRMGYQIEVTYVNGWPHASLQAAASAGDMTLSIDDTTGWFPPPETGIYAGATATLYDPLYQETITCMSAGTQSGPGTIALAAPLAYDHAVGIVASTLPQSVIQAAILFCVSQALVRGATATVAPGSGSAGGGKDAMHYAVEAEQLVHAYRRIV
jgi:hypothetical protein